MISLPPGGRYDQDRVDQYSECHIVADMIKIMTKTNMIRMPPNGRYDQDQDNQNATRCSGGRYPGIVIEWIFYWIESSQIKIFESIFELNFLGKKIIE